MKEIIVGNKENGAIMKLSNKGELYIQELFDEDDIDCSIHLIPKEVTALKNFLNENLK